MNDKQDVNRLIAQMTRTILDLEKDNLYAVIPDSDAKMVERIIKAFEEALKKP